MNVCKDCGVQFQPLPGKEWAHQCFECWKKGKNQPKSVTAQFPVAVGMNNDASDERKQRLIVRQNALSRACEFALAGKLEVAEGDNNMVKLFELAERLEAWIMR